MTGLTSLWALEGRWRITRTIDHGSGQTDQFTGEALFHRSGPRLIQDETGTLTIGTQNLDANQRYIWESESDALNVYFADLRPFHTVPLRSECPTTVHLCDPDRYEVTYSFTDWPDWQAKWHVEGPRKDYVMRSDYCRS